MIIDSSAIIAVLLKEPGHEELLQHLVTAECIGVGAPTMVETAMVLQARLGAAGKSLLARLAQEADFDIVAFTAEHWIMAADAFVKYGKGRHKAALNFGDCLTYAAGNPQRRSVFFDEHTASLSFLAHFVRDAPPISRSSRNWCSRYGSAPFRSAITKPELRYSVIKSTAADRPSCIESRSS